MSTVSVRFSEDIMEDLNKVCQFSDRSKNYTIVQAVKGYLKNKIEDIGDAKDADEIWDILSNPNTKFYSSEEVSAFLDANCEEGK
jgi:predicted transcriptional regulator